MHIRNEFKEKILNIIGSSGFPPDEEKNWAAIFSGMSDFQEEALRNIPVPPLKNPAENLHIQCGITCLEKNQLGNNYYFMSVADDISAEGFPDGNIDGNETVAKDGDWFIIGTGYLDCEYEDLFGICGRDRKYTGKYSGGEFEYSLVLKNNILNREKLLYKAADLYRISDPVIFAPMLRRMVYIETPSELRGKITGEDLQPEKNGLGCLLGGWRAVWNVEITDSPYGTKSVSGLKYIPEENEYIIPAENNSCRLKISEEYDPEREQKYIIVSSGGTDIIKNYLCKVRICPVNSENDILTSGISLYNNHGSINQEISRIYSRSDIFSFMNGFSRVAVCDGIYTDYPEGLKVCAYEKGFEYPFLPEYLDFSARPEIYISFVNDGKKFLFDRIVYLVHILQRRFPEYIWKGGYFV